MKTYELATNNDARASFYGKARVIDSWSENGKIELWSYGTHVATVYPGAKNKAEVYGTYSQTTLRHIKEFLLQNGFKAINKAQIVKDYIK